MTDFNPYEDTQPGLRLPHRDDPATWPAVKDAAKAADGHMNYYYKMMTKANMTRTEYEKAFEEGRQQGMRQERALWELSKSTQEIEASQPGPFDWYKKAVLKTESGSFAHEYPPCSITEATHRRVFVEAGHASHYVYYPKDIKLVRYETEVSWIEPGASGWQSKP